MKFLELCQKRTSIRSFQSQPVKREDILYILEAARHAPSAVNFQPWHFIVIQEEENRLALHDCYHREWFRTAPLYIIVCADFEQSWKRKSDEKDFGEIDATIAVEHICLAATDLGLGSCWVCNFDNKKLIELLELPKHISPIAILPIGYINLEVYPELPNKLRKPLNELVHWEKFKQVSE
ncbi:MAG: nitroreductase family protein [Bacteroidales bacterium]|nr:nitroreductase family protein [Bacteroidales bacterium]